MKHQKSRYLQPNRLSDILAAIQTMSLYHRYRRSSEEWADLISGETDKATYWKCIFDEHPEFESAGAKIPH